MDNQHRPTALPFYIVVLAVIGHFCTSTTVPLFGEKPFVVLWNAPVSQCQKLKIPLDLSSFLAVTTPSRVRNQSLTLFYKNRIGLFPYVHPESLKEHNGGIPQQGNLSASLTKAKEEFTQSISESSTGLAVMDWEEWLPMFERNFDAKSIYKNLSLNFTLQHNASLNLQQASSEAKRQFQEAAQSFMEETLKLALILRPRYLWGYYLFPDCYNYNFEEPNYTGICSEQTRRFNDDLLWLWESSSALFPSAYLPVSVSGSRNAALFVRHQVREATRVASIVKRRATAPIYVYLRPLLRDQKKLYMSETDLISSIGESAALGASGCIMWGASADYNDKASCEALSAYLSETLNPYIANVTLAAQLCSQSLCRGRRRCVRKDYNSDDYLHLSSQRHQISQNPTTAELTYWRDRFTCQCYEDRNCRVDSS